MTAETAWQRSPVSSFGLLKPEPSFLSWLHGRNERSMKFEPRSQPSPTQEVCCEDAEVRPSICALE